MSDLYRNRSRNAVLVKDDIGKAKPTVYDLPAEGHSYGRSEPADLEGAREVTMHWASHMPRPKVGPECQDFRKLNRVAAKSGVANAKQLADFRKDVDIKLIPPGPAGCLPKVIPSDVIKSFSYGKKSRPSTPISHVVGNQYAMEYEEVLQQHYRALEESQGPSGKTRIKLTKGSKLQIANAKTMRQNLLDPPEAPEPWKMSKFSKVSSRLALAGKSASMPNLRRSDLEHPSTATFGGSAEEL
jgi:hypothetical protein